VREDLDARDGHEDDKRRLGGGTGTLVDGLEQMLIAAGDAHADDGEGEDVEDDDTVEHSADSGAHRLTRFLGLKCDGGQGLHTTERESSLGKHGPEAEELGLATGEVHELAVERLVALVAESTAVLVRASSEVDDKTEKDEANDGGDLEGGEPEFKLSKVLNTGNVNKDGGETHGRVNVTSGELDESRGRQVVTHHLSERVHHGTDKKR
jgi:hypothetical protein